MGHFTIRDLGEYEFEEKKSIFIAHTKRVECEKDAKDYILEIKQSYKDAKHNVYAYIIGDNKGIQRYSDDGEPQGTAGIPVLEVIKKSNLSDIVVVVTRYFGGILLGAGGLNRAYTKAASEVIKNAEVVEKVEGRTVSFSFDYDFLGKIQYSLEQKGIHIEEVNYSDKVEILIYRESNQTEEVVNLINELTSARCKINIFNKDIYFKKESRLIKILN